MIIGIIGTTCAGKKTLVKILVEEHKFVKYETDCGVVDKLVKEGWKKDCFIVVVLNCWQQLTLLRKRPFFLLVSIDAPLWLRFKRASEVLCCTSLETFVKEHDRELVDTSFCSCGKHKLNKTNHHWELSRLGSLMRSADIQLFNDDTLDVLRNKVISIRIANPERLRPSWNTYFIRIAYLAATRSNCMKRRVGALVVRDNRIVSTGYNGTPIGTTNCNDSGCLRCNSFTTAGHNLDECLCLHAEENAIIEAGRERCKNATLYSNVFPCLSCAKKIVQAGISKVVYHSEYSIDIAAKKLFQAANIEVVQIFDESLTALPDGIYS
ncbi:dCMP deaminase [Galdieria sulphuraria]|uniref:Deoxycytidylate deaminase n=1 Tax=Galdieria sulphuraria TaxID=130081 RepID=M2Y6F9_GALSU|nr:dCMP deaminase [Galdieria sulphuraria]EME31618.1 dCMP deaminase [Galdieria sulphuraria]|eukprot:XP_005708138.1 dCMP deaminase [Galdieria sulphuraria]